MGFRQTSACAMLALVVSACHSPATPSSTSSAPAARRYRDATKHTPESVRADRFRLDAANQPALYRSYAGAETLALPAPRVLTQPAMEAIATPASSAATLDVELLATLLFLSGGITRTLPSGRDIRATAAAGALYPNELYAVTADLAGLPAGVYHYDPKNHRLTRLRSGDWRAVLARAADDPEIGTAPVTLMVTGILWRSAWKYRERAYRHLYWDGGMVLANVLAAANAAGLPSAADAAFVDTEVDRLIGLDGRHEASLAMVRVGRGLPPTAEAPREAPPLTVEPNALSPSPIEYPAALRYHAASQLADAAAVRAVRGARFERSPPDASRAASPLPRWNAVNTSLDAVVRHRSSTRHFTHRPISAADLSAILAGPISAVPADFLRVQRSLIETYVIVHAVTGVAPGAYYYRVSDRRLEPFAAGDFRDTAGFLSLNQALARDASAVIYYMADLNGIGRAFGERGHRLAELEAGLRAGRAYLAAYAHGRGASGLTFFDDEVTRLFSPHADGLEPLLVVAVGVPAKSVGSRSKP